MKNVFLQICVGCFSVCSFNFLYGFYCGLFDKMQDEYIRGFFGCLTWWVCYDVCLGLGWIKND